MWFLQIVRSFFYMLDSTLFNFIPTVYDLLISISRTSILSQGQIKQFADRIQLLLGVFMLFKVSFSLITYIVNPDDFSDKAKGFGKLWMNIILSLIMLIGVPYIFSMAYDLQARVLEDNVIGTLILGQKPEDNYINTAGQNMAYSIMIPFFLPNVSNNELTTCVNLYNEAGDFNEECRTKLYEVTNRDANKKEAIIENYRMGVENKSLGLTFRLDIAKEIIKKGDEGFLIEYKIPISTVVAVVVLLLLITFSMDVALRSIKLAFLQLISPIPIISFIDPKSGKDGMFKKWYQMCFNTYISLFIRLAALYFGVYIISKVNGMYDIINGSTISDFWVQVFIIIGVLMFVKQLPKIIEGLGIKLDGAKFQLNPFKKIEDEAIGGKRITGALAGATAGTVGMLTGAGGLRTFTGAVGGFVGGKGFAEGYKNAAAKNKTLRNLNRIDRNPFRRTFGRIDTGIRSAIGAPTMADDYENRISQIDEDIKNLDNQMAPNKKLIEEKNLYANVVSDMEKRAVSKIENGEAGKLSEEYNYRKAKVESLKAQLDQASRDAANDPTNTTKQATVDALQRQFANAEIDAKNFLNDSAMMAYIDANRGNSVTVGGITYTAADIFGVDGSGNAKSDAALETMTTKMENIVDTYGSRHSNMVKGTASQLHSSTGKLKGEASNLEQDNEKYERRKRDLNENKSRLYEEQRRPKSYQDALK